MTLKEIEALVKEILEVQKELVSFLVSHESDKEVVLKRLKEFELRLVKLEEKTKY